MLKGMSDLTSLDSKAHSKRTFLRLRFLFSIASLVSFAGCTEVYGPSRVGQVSDVALSKDGRIIAVAGKRPRTHREGLLEVYDLKAGKLVGDIKTEHSITSVAVAPDGSRLAYVVANVPMLYICKVSDSIDSQAILELPNRHGPIINQGHLHFSKSGKYLYGVVDHKQVNVWNTDTFHLVSKVYSGDPMSTTMSNDEQWLAVGSWGGEIKVYSTGDWESVNSIEGNLPVFDMDFSSNGEFLATTVVTNKSPCMFSRHVWSTKPWKLVREFAVESPWVVFDPTGNRLAIQNEDDSITWLALPGFALEKVRFEGAGWMLASAGDPRVVVGHRYRDEEICVWSWNPVGETRLLHTIQWDPRRVPFAMGSTALITEAHTK